MEPLRTHLSTWTPSNAEELAIGHLSARLTLLVKFRECPPVSAAPVPIEHRWLGLDRRLFGPTLGIAVVVLLWAVLLPAIDDAVPFAEEIPAGTVIDVGPKVQFTPHHGWGFTSAGQIGAASVSIHRGGLIFTVTAGSFGGSADELMDVLNDQLDLDRIAGPRATVHTNQGVTGVSEAFHGPDYQGQLFSLTDEGVGVEVNVQGPGRSLHQYQGEVDQMVASIRFAEATS